VIFDIRPPRPRVQRDDHAQKCEIRPEIDVAGERRRKARGNRNRAASGGVSNL